MRNLVKDMFDIGSVFSPAKGVIGVGGALLSPFLAEMTNGGKAMLLLALFLIIAGDWLTGLAASKKDGTYASEYGIAGVARSIVILGLPFIGLVLDMAFMQATGITEPRALFYGIITMLIYHNWESLTANAVRAGWSKWIPDSVINYVSSEIQSKMNRAAQRGGVVIQPAAPTQTGQSGGIPDAGDKRE